MKKTEIVTNEIEDLELEFTNKQKYFLAVGFIDELIMITKNLMELETPSNEVFKQNPAFQRELYRLFDLMGKYYDLKSSLTIEGEQELLLWDLKRKLKVELKDEIEYIFDL